MKRLSIILTNDDGASAKGLAEFAQALGAMGDVTTIVPERHRSGVGHSMSISDPLQVTRHDNGTYLASGFPADCVKFALCKILDSPPDLVVSGINKGENTGVSVFYSGTVGGAREGALNGVTSFAVSMGTECDAASSKIIDIAMDVIRTTFDLDLPVGSLLNVNIPSGEPCGTRVARQGTGPFNEELIPFKDPRNREYFWFAGEQDTVGEEDTDVVLFKQNYVTITPLKCDETDEALMDRIKDSGSFDQAGRSEFA